MKKYMFFSLLIMIGTIFMIPNVKADYDMLVPFAKGATTSTISSNGTVSTQDFGTVEAGSAYSLRVLACDTTGASGEGTTYNISINNCTSDVNVTYSIDNSNIATIANGYINFLASGSAIITASASGYSDLVYPLTVEVTNTSSTETSTKDSDTNEDVIIEEDEVTEVPKEKVVKKNNSVGGTQTSANPSTGIAVAGIYFILFAFIAGFSVLIYRKYYQQRLGAPIRK